MLNIECNINPMQEYISEYVEMDNGLIAHRYNICATTFVSYDVYERSMVGAHQHSSFFSTEEYGCLGDITTRRLPQEIDALPAYSEERYQAVKAYHAALKQQAEQAIYSAFPQDFV